MARRFISASSQTINLPSAIPMSTSAATLSAWIYGTSFPAAYNCFWGLQATNGGMKVYVKSSGTIAYYVGNSGIYDGTGTFTLSAAKWYHTAFLITATATAGYIGGVQDATNASFPLVWTPGPVFKLGDDGLTRFWNGYMADACIWNIGLTVSEIRMLASGLRAKYIRPDKIIAYYPLSGTQPYEPDLSAYANHGTLNGPVFVPDPPLIPDMNQILTIAGREVPIMSLGPSFIPGWSRQSNLSVIGGGTF